MGDYEEQALPPSLASWLTVRADVVRGDDAVLLDLRAEPGAPLPHLSQLRFTGLQAQQLGEALYLAGASATWARFRRETEERRG